MELSLTAAEVALYLPLTAVLAPADGRVDGAQLYVLLRCK